ncbi:efflux RND transporter periplasmic adaptor subunit [Neorhodopirellula lusitana]|uniref:efflux RND transporter periplasmic adaptor subunit n=1 Tax=Neorhodopirellula lusitana TaxID=445327 RepID=UPI0038501332
MTSSQTKRDGGLPRWWIAGGVVALIAIAGIWHIQTSLAKSPKLRTVEIQRGDLRTFIAATGTVEPHEVVEVGALVSGAVVSFGDGQNAPARIGSQSTRLESPVQVGTSVVQGGVLARLDPALYQLAVDRARSSLRLAEAEIGRLRTQLERSERELQRAQQLRNTNSESQYDSIATSHAIALAELDIANARREQAEGQVEQAEVNLSRTIIRSPIDGVVIDHRINLGQNAGPSSPGLFLVTRSLQDMRIRTSVSETDIGKVFPGQPVSFTVDGHRDQTMSGRVEQILMNARVQGNFVTYDVLVEMDQHDVNLLPHMTADVQLETVHRKNAWLVPSESLEWSPDNELANHSDEHSAAPENTDSSNHVIWIANADGGVKPVSVKVGVDDGVRTEIMADGIAESMPVVVGTIRETTLARIIPSVKTLR